MTDTSGLKGLALVAGGPLHAPDLDGRAVQDLPVAVPGAVGDSAAAGGVAAANVPKALLPPLLEVAVLILHVLRRKLEFLDAINFNKSEVKLPRNSERDHSALNVIVWVGQQNTPGQQRALSGLGAHTALLGGGDCLRRPLEFPFQLN